MKITRPIALIASIGLVILATNLINSSVTSDQFSLRYPPVVCAPKSSGLTSAISLASAKVPLRVTGSKSLSLKASKTLRYIQKENSITVEAQGVTPITWQVREGKWAGAALCLASTSSQWFVGGTADVTSQGKILLVNSGLSSAVAEIEIWTEAGSQLTRTVALRADSQVALGLDSLAPGSKELVLNVIARSGRLSAFMVDERGRGLRALGGDLVNSNLAPAKVLNIPAIPHILQKSGKKETALSHSLRILNPGETDARITVEVISSDGIFIPTGFDERLVPSAKVLSLNLSPNLPAGKFGIRITSDQPVVAGVYSKTFAFNKSDFIWSTAVPELTDLRVAISGLTPQLIFTGGSIDLSLELFYINGKRGSERVRGEDIALYQLPEGVRSVIFSEVGRGIFGGALLSSKSGYGYFPLTAGSSITKASIPTSNIRVLTP